MKLKVLLLPERKLQTAELENGADGFQLLKSIGLNPESVIIFRADKPIPVDSRLRPNDDLKVVRVVSGG